MLSLCLYNLYAEHMMQNARVDESQAAFKCLGEISITDMKIMASGPVTSQQIEVEKVKE